MARREEAASPTRRPLPHPRWRRAVLVVFAVAALLVLVGATYQALGNVLDARRHPPPGEFVDVGDGRLHLHCVGDGAPTTVLDAGGGDTSLSWRAVQEALSDDLRVCAFDRSGFGWSDELGSVHSVTTYVDHQERLLEASGLEEPYLLVGHSLGGLNAQVFAARAPERVAGMVLVDAAHPELFDRVPELLNAESDFVSAMRVLSRLGVVRLAFATGLVDPLAGIDVAPEVHISYLAQLSRPRHWDSVHRMGLGLAESLAAVRDVSPPPDIPTIVLTHGIPDQFEGLDDDADDVERIWQELQAELAAGFDNARLVVVHDSGHLIPLEAPDAVVAAVLEVAAASR